METRTKLRKKGESAKRESRFVEFKEKFNQDNDQDWCEILKDVVAMANSGGGLILFGVQDDGKKSRMSDGKNLLDLDSADIDNRFFKYTGVHIIFEITEIQRGRRNVVAMIIDKAYPPIIFIRPGTYAVDGSKQGRAFSEGVLYVRHGAKSAAATSGDLEAILEKEIERRKSVWLGNIKQVIQAPVGQAYVLAPSIENQPNGFRISQDEDAPSVRLDEESLFEDFYKNDTAKVVETCRILFKDFKTNRKFYKALNALKRDPSIYRVRYLNAKRRLGSSQGFYSDKVFQELSKLYQKKC